MDLAALGFKQTKLVVDFGGNYVTYAHCAYCGQPVQYPTERPYNVCPYCGMRIIYGGKNDDIR